MAVTLMTYAKTSMRMDGRANRQPVTQGVDLQGKVKITPFASMEQKGHG